MKVVIFAGGQGSRLSEETVAKPKPMVEIGGKPILWHIMKIYSHYGFNEFIICLGYKGDLIKEWFANYFLHNSDITIDLKENSITTHQNNAENWKVTLIDTGLNSMTATRLAKVKDYIGNEDFMLTYGDGVSNVDIKKLLDFHKSHNKIATVTAVRPDGRFGILKVNQESGQVDGFVEKNEGRSEWINGGFFVLRPEVFSYLPEDDVMWEMGPMQKLSADKEIMAFVHDGFWKAMDTLRDKNQLDSIWNSEKPAWKLWS
jgi:glucose-1-phosphate cytidylyltransferase